MKSKTEESAAVKAPVPVRFRVGKGTLQFIGGTAAPNTLINLMSDDAERFEAAGQGRILGNLPAAPAK